MSVLQRAEQRLASRVLKLDHKLPFLVLRFRRVDHALHLIVRQAGKLFLLIDDYRRCIPLLQHILFEIRLQCRQLGVDLLQLLLVGVGQLRACAHKILVVTLE